MGRSAVHLTFLALALFGLGVNFVALVLTFVNFVKLLLGSV
jgi:hypothetical protein